MFSVTTAMHASYLEELCTGADALGVSITPTQAKHLLEYVALLTKWNATYNLTAVRDPAEMIVRHLLDSLSILPVLPKNLCRWLDVGSGAGLPGVPLAIVLPEHSFTLLDSNGKKTRFLTQVKAALDLQNLQVVHERIEMWHPEGTFDRIVSRAFSSLLQFIKTSRHLVHSETRWLAMKGVYPTAELEELSNAAVLEAAHLLTVPGGSEQRHLLLLRPTFVQGV